MFLVPMFLVPMFLVPMFLVPMFLVPMFLVPMFLVPMYKSLKRGGCIVALIKGSIGRLNSVYKTCMLMINNIECSVYSPLKICTIRNSCGFIIILMILINCKNVISQMEFNRTGESDSWHISYLEYKNYTKSGANLVVFNNSEVSKEINGFVQQAFECGWFSYYGYVYMFIYL